MIPVRYSRFVYMLILSGMMSGIISGVTTIKAIGFQSEVIAIWHGAWMSSWIIAFPVVTFVAPLTRRIVDLLERPESSHHQG